MKKLLILFFLFGISRHAVYAQDEKKQALGLLQQLAATFKNTAQLSFDVQYKYAAEEAPAVYLDSLNGHFKLSGNRYWYDLDNTEAICTSDYLIMLFREDNVMYLARPTATGINNPVALIDSFLLNNANITCHLTGNKQWNIISLTFPASYPCRKMEYYIDKETGWLVKTVNVVRSEELYEPAARSLIEGAITYAIVEAWYTNYRKDGFDNHVFDNDRYFKKQGMEYVTVAPFDTYKIFLGTPNL
jgi:hypothetical protein